MARYSKRRVVIYALAIVLGFGITVRAVEATSHEDGLFNRVRMVFNVVQAWHKDGADLDTFIKGAIQGGLEALGDPYTNYFAPEEYSAFVDSINGTFSGIGAYLEQDGRYVIISAPIKGTPAFKAGLVTGDRILEVDGISLVGSTTERAVQLIRGPTGTEVRLKIERPAESRTLTVTLTRAAITIPEVESRMLAEQIGYVQLISFGGNSVSEFYKAVSDLKAQGARALVLDLRQNPGGYLDAAVSIASGFVPEGKPVLWEVGKEGKKAQLSNGYKLINLPTAVLVDKGSASASEIVAGAIQDYGSGVLVGTQTFGKGTVQQILNLSAGGGMKVTVAEYLTPKERQVHGIGLKPEYEVEALKPDPQRTEAMEFKRFMRITSVGLDVLQLQHRLADLGYTPEVDGFFGLKTAGAVQQFALENEILLPPEPMVDGLFIDALNSRVANHFKQVKLADVQLNKAIELILDGLK